MLRVGIDRAPASWPFAYQTMLMLVPTFCRLWGCWSTTGSAVLALQRSVVGGCLRLLPVRQAYSLSSALLMFTDGLPTLLLALHQQWAAAPAQRPAWLAVMCRLANFACGGLESVLFIVSHGLAREGAGAGETVPDVATASAVARLLRGTTARPALVLAALGALAHVVELCTAVGLGAPEAEAGGWMCVPHLSLLGHVLCWLAALCLTHPTRPSAPCRRRHCCCCCCF